MHVLSTADVHRLHLLLITLAPQGMPVPSVLQLQELVDQSFWASLEQEEGRPVRFTLSFSMTAYGPVGDPFIFKEVQDLTIVNIIKLSPALLLGRSAIGVVGDPDTSLKIWGIAPLPTLALTVEAVGSGHIIVRFLDRNRIILRAGQVIFLSNDQSDNLLFLVHNLSQFEQPITQKLLIEVEALKKVINAMLRQGHGGTLLWVPEDMDWQLSVKSSRYPCHAYRELADFVNKLACESLPEFDLALGDYRNSPLYHSVALRLQRIKPMIEAMGQLTAVDGATVISENLEILAFGVMLRAEGVDGTAAVLELGQATNTLDLQSFPLSKLGGARHRSAAEFCCSHKRSLAFVASQDGTLTIFGWQAQTNRLFAIRRAELDSI